MSDQGDQGQARPPREDVTPSGVAALRSAADNMPLGWPGGPWSGAADWLRRRADGIEQHLTGGA